MVHTVYHGGHTDAGFFIHAINTYYCGDAAKGINASIKTRDVITCSDLEIDSAQFIPLFIPVLDEWRLKDADIIHKVLRGPVVRAVNEGRCRIFFDFSNEAGTETLLELLCDILKDAGVDRLNSAWLICQNRMLTRNSSQLVQPILFDFFLLAGVSAAVKSIPAYGNSLLVNAIHTNTKPYNITCLNATPRMHRVNTVLEILSQNLHDSHNTVRRGDYAMPYVSMPLLNDSKGSPISKAEIEQYLIASNQSHLMPHLKQLIGMLPLKADHFSEKGNQLVTKVNLDHYLESLISVVTETGVNTGIKRITEKTIKPLALGHPFVIIGHNGSVEMARELGFSAMDNFIDHSYDTIKEPIERLRSAIGSAKDFIERIRSGRVNTKDLSMHAQHNMNWAYDGFLTFYWSKYVEPILGLLRS